MKHRRFTIIAGIIFVLVIAVLYIYIYTIPEITGALKETVTVEYGQMRIADKVSAVLVREEYVIKAENSGKVSYYLEDNTKTRKGVKILDIYGSETTSLICPQTGVISYYVDGYENVLSSDNLGNVLSFIPESGVIEVKDIRADSVKENDPLVKLITSEVFYTVFKISPDRISDYKEGGSVSLEFETGSVAAKISSIIPIYGSPDSDDETAENAESTESTESAVSLDIQTSDSAIAKQGPAEDEAASEDEASTEELPIESYLVTVSTAKYFQDFDKLRICDVNVVLKDDKGLIVPNTAIAEEDGVSGVYVKKIDGDYLFTRIKVINTDGINSVVYADSFTVLRDDGLTDTFGTISIYDEILKDASEYN